MPFHCPHGVDVGQQCVGFHFLRWYAESGNVVIVTSLARFSRRVHDNVNLSIDLCFFGIVLTIYGHDNQKPRWRRVTSSQSPGNGSSLFRNFNHAIPLSQWP
jgi:hypothetical protein